MLAAIRKDRFTKHPGKYVQWDKILKASRAPQVNRITAQSSFKHEGFPALSRHCREKPEAKPEHEQERETTCDVLHKKPVEYFEDEVAMILDCKMFHHEPHRKIESSCSATGRLLISVHLAK